MTITAKEAADVMAAAHCCYNKVEVEHAIDRMAEEITAQLGQLEPLLLCVMNGGLIITGGLLLRLDFALDYDYIHATRYAGKTRGSDLNWISRPHKPLAGRHVLIIDDILDEGITLQELTKYCEAENVASVRTAVLVNKLHDRKSLSTADFIGLDVEDRYVFGYGMDYKGYLRNVPGIYAVDE
ncbi:MAG: hypoxanthine-guanine phosphoribosyltransferase [Gammaproteobacteria bacterium SG8_15]|nr:MAG: hypoxanthine-guanine phosphoribosyltransferase [Gammaproteobacteria bacterium SG8_15]